MFLLSVFQTSQLYILKVNVIRGKRNHIVFYNAYMKNEHPVGNMPTGFYVLIGSGKAYQKEAFSKFSSKVLAYSSPDSAARRTLGKPADAAAKPDTET